MFKLRRKAVNIFHLFPPQVGDYFPLSEYFDDGNYNPCLIDF